MSGVAIVVFFVMLPLSLFAAAAHVWRATHAAQHRWYSYVRAGLHLLVGFGFVLMLRYEMVGLWILVASWVAMVALPWLGRPQYRRASK